MENLYEATVERYRKYVMPTYAPKILFVRGEGARLWDADGREYLDFATGISVCNLGHCHPGVTAAVRKQAATLVHVSNLYMNEVMPRLAEKLIENCFDGVVFFANSGAEANEGMFKLARKIGNASGRNEIISMDNSFHGRTLATLAATGRAKYRKGFEPDMPGFRQVPFNDIEALKNAVNDKTCAVVLEPVQGEGGILPADLEYLKQVRALCDEKGILLLFDEVQCGMGRIGTRFAWQSFGVEPDAFSMAKAIANGLPMGGFITKRKYADTLTPGTHASTFGGTALVSAAALAVQEAFDNEGVLENCREQGEYLRRQLGELGKKYPFVKGVRGMGLMIGVVLDREAATLAGLCLKRNLVVLTAGETVLRLLPPLNLTRAEADEGIGKIAAALEELNAAIQEG
ncbi:aspartate aminotransferase family protein [Victivallis lenta]|uniref:aspartate aminotransferase family protein n=1 Tax=Victivallis lenta TaxID=2606640 RepID=UPI000D023E93|nr:aspartate aminotransferase family protein [Victivallis lenta]AVM44838.1 aspartate aminotransferase family protein [Victivallales bacterium CCUG 44730]MBS5530016.1 aspartate aminotransferase family protein [bacterium]HBP07823.1 aspartate aminotransferase family protein [Lentisphaeria bacterium]HCH86546.1 aspartate aminotransferase family protein [Lentisphaeria bacterium]